MSKPSNFVHITPFMHVTDLNKAVAFFTDVLGFEVLSRFGKDYAYLEREGCGMRILESHGADGAPPGNRRFCYYIDVRDVDALFAELKPKLETLPQGHWMGPRDQPYGQRELMILAPDGNILAFGQAMVKG
jgi:catechol 2,3-dioxygenase-like lactoylglutathione lyase family enzyme